jgi:hypothetical protein
MKKMTDQRPREIRSDEILKMLLNASKQAKEFGSSQVGRFDREPTALEFSQMVRASRPVVFKSESSFDVCISAQD